MRRLLRRLALARPQARAWALYDWANSVFLTTVVQLFPVYFLRVAASDVAPTAAAQHFTLATSLGLMVTAILAPLLGAIADHARLKKAMLATFAGLGVLSTLGLALVGPGDWRLGVLLFVAGNVGLNGSQVFADSLLPHVARRREVDRLVAAGFALGYLSGGLLLGLNALWIGYPAAFGLPDAGTAMRAAFLSAGLWWAAFSLPLLRRVPEPGTPAARPEPVWTLVAVGLRRLRRTFQELRTYRHAFLFLLAFLLYADASSTIVRLGTLYGTELGVPTQALILAVLAVQLVGVPCCLAFGALGQRIGTQRALYVALSLYALVTLWGSQVRGTAGFFALALAVGTVQGGSQALSRALFARLVPRARSAEFFGFYGVFEKLGSVVGPAVFAASLGTTGSSRAAVASLSLFFVAGMLLLTRVDVAAGARAASAS